MPTEIFQRESSIGHAEQTSPTYHLNSRNLSLDVKESNTTEIIPNNQSRGLAQMPWSIESGQTASNHEVDHAFEVLQGLFLADDRVILEKHHESLGQLILQVGQLEHRMNDEGALVEVVNPIIANSIEAAIRDNRDQMIDVLYPIIGSLIQRAVSEAMVDMKRQVDTQMSKAFDLEQLKRRLHGWFAGVPLEDTMMIDGLPFEIGSIFFIHRETGIPIVYLANDSTDTITDSDIIGGMLTAIRDFMADVFANNDEGRDGESDEIQQGDNRILIESARYSYIAVVTNGYAPRGFRGNIHKLLLDIESKHADLLRNYDGDATPFAPARTQLYDFMVRQNDKHLNIETEAVPPQPNLLNPLKAWMPELLQAKLHIALPFVLLILTILIFFL